MLDNKLLVFGLGVVAGAAFISVAKTPAFKKACASLVGKGLQLKDDAAAFAEAVKEDAQDIVAEANYNAKKGPKA
ncbi:MAG: hypothetical protein K6F15_02670 [Treponema sp.]|nr:hypothetical protein [Treponema sp.]